MAAMLRMRPKKTRNAGFPDGCGNPPTDRSKLRNALRLSAGCMYSGILFQCSFRAAVNRGWSRLTAIHWRMASRSFRGSSSFRYAFIFSGAGVSMIGCVYKVDAHSRPHTQSENKKSINRDTMSFSANRISLSASDICLSTVRLDSCSRSATS